LAALALMALALPRLGREGESVLLRREGNEVRIVIPEGTAELIAAGQTPGLIHDDKIVLTLSGQATLTIVNQDRVRHRVGPFAVGPGQTLSQTFTRPATYLGSCSLLINDVRIIVQR
jgi:hypothetical protein